MKRQTKSPQIRQQVRNFVVLVLLCASVSQWLTLILHHPAGCFLLDFLIPVYPRESAAETLVNI